MEDNILVSVKKNIGLEEEYDVFDITLLTHINAGLSELSQIGVGPNPQTDIDHESLWSSLGIPQNILSMARSYIYLYVKMLFDPPATSFHIGAINEQMEKLVWRMNVAREETDYVAPV